MVTIHFIRVVEPVKLLEISLVGFLEVSLYVGEVDDIAISVVFIWAVYTSESL